MIHTLQPLPLPMRFKLLSRLRLKCREGPNAGKPGPCPGPKKPGQPTKPRAPAAQHDETIQGARRALSEGDQQALDAVETKVRESAGKRGGLGVAGLRAVASALGMKAGKLNKAGLVAGIQEKIGSLKKDAPARELQARADHMKLAERGTGIKFTDRVINGLLAYSGADKDPAFREAYTDILRHGPDAKAESFAHLRDKRKAVLEQLKKGDVPESDIKFVLGGLADAGYGRLSPKEFEAHLFDKLGEKTEAKPDSSQIIPDDLKLEPAPKTKPKKKPKASEPDYIDRLRAPLTDRLSHVTTIERQSGIPFPARVIVELAGDQANQIPESRRFLELANTMSNGGHVSDNDRKWMSGFRASVVSQIKHEDVDPVRVGAALESLDNRGLGSVSQSEFMGMLKKKTGAAA